MYQVANFSKACREAKCLSVDVASFPFEIPENLPQQNTTYVLVPFFWVVVLNFSFLFRYLANEYILRFDCGIFSMLYMDHWEGQEFKTFEPVSLSTFFI
jgi:hypothetical protein